jgi:sugar phosphate isomerase/epimerase
MIGGIGVVTSLNKEGSELHRVKEYGLNSCQLISWDPTLWTAEIADKVAKEAQSLEIRIVGFWAGWSGPAVWDLVDGPETLGIVPEKYRTERKQYLIQAGGFAQIIGTPAVITHLGFIPENPSDPRFSDVVDTVREIAEEFKALGLQFWFESGQETPITLLRLIRSVGTSNLGINLDPANLILYGKANPIDALGILGDYVKCVHAKDGRYPNDPMRTGQQVRVGDGQVDFPRFLKRLEEIGYSGELIIEREIKGEKQIEDIVYTINYLQNLLGREGNHTG